MFRILLGLVTLLLSIFVGQYFLNEDTTGLADANQFPKRRQLQRAAWNSSTWVILYLADTPEEKENYEKILRPLDGQTYRRTNIKVFEYQQALDSMLARSPVFVIGQHLPNKLTEHLNKLPDLSFRDQQAQLGTWPLDQSQDLLQLTYLPSPYNDTLPMHLIWGQQLSSLQNYLQDRLSQGIRSFLWSAWGYEVQRDGQTAMQGYFNDSTWRMDRQVHFEFSSTPGDTWSTPSANIRAYDGASAPPANWLERLAADRIAIQKFTAHASLPPLSIQLYPSVERKALRTGSMEQAHMEEEEQAVHLVINDNFQGQEWGVQYRPWLRTALKKAKHPFYESGLSLQWIDNIRGRSWRSWVHTLAKANALPSFELLFDENARQEQSPLIGHLAAAAWVDYRLDKLGHEAFLKEYRDGISAVPAHQVYQDWIKWIRTNYPAIDTTYAPVPKQRLHGFTFAHEGYRIYNGYGSARAFASLRAMQQTGIEAVAIVPYSFMPNANRPDPIPVAQRAGSENDEATVFAHLSAQSLGQFTLLKPQIWMGGGSWPGDISFDKEADWQAFFTYYDRWIQHYALLSAMYGFDAFCIGTELRHTTLQQPEKWRELIASIRHIYTGPLTYAANWGEECEKLTFWPELDFIGINCYYPLYEGENPSDADLQQGADRIVEKMQAVSKKAQRPVWLTEVGYRSATAPWEQPHAEAGNRAIDEQAQARAYEVMLTACRDEKWLLAYFWWKWPCDLDHDESRGRGYSPFGKPAEKVLSSAYLEE